MRRTIRLERRREARRASAYRLNVYHAAIRDAEAMTDAAWLDAWVRALEETGADIPWVPRLLWLQTLQAYVTNESKRLADSVGEDAA